MLLKLYASVVTVAFAYPQPSPVRHGSSLGVPGAGLHKQDAAYASFGLGEEQMLGLGKEQVLERLARVRHGSSLGVPGRPCSARIARSVGPSRRQD